MIETCATASPIAGHSVVLREAAAEVEGLADEEAAPSVRRAAGRCPAGRCSACRIEVIPGLESRKVALGKHEVVLLHLVHQFAARLAEPQRGPTILDRLEAGGESLGRAIEVCGLLGIAENLIERRPVELVVR